jgi:ribonuclease R
MPQPDYEQEILDLISTDGYRPLKPKAIVKKLGHGHESAGDVKRAIKKLLKRGKIVYGENHLVGKPDGSHHNRMTGMFRRMEGGFGFVTPAGAVRGPGEKSEDIYIAAKNARDAASGDTVLVRVFKGKTQGRSRGAGEGEIVKVLERQTHEFVGTYMEAAGASYVRVDGRIFSKPISVGDPGAKGAQPEDKVVFEMVRFPSHAHDGEGVITEVLGARGSPGVDTLSIIREFNLPGEFPDEVIENAREQAEDFDERIDSSRRDLTDMTIITIDPFDARDFDDAISLEKQENGHWLLGVHIADVSHFVQQKTVLDREARDRATSVYLPDRVIPMLPEVISNNLASLQPDRVRYTKTVFIEFTAEGTRVSVEPCAAAIKSKRRFTYQDVDDYLANPERWKRKLKMPVHVLLRNMHTLAMILRARRFKRGSLELTMPEVKIDLDKNGRVSGAHVTENTESHQIIEEFMLAANEAVAELLKDEDRLFLRRVHESPDPRKLQALTDFVRELGIKTESLESRFEIQKVLEKVRNLPTQHAVNYAVLRSMQKAIYGPAEEGHYALASDCYCHFTSPIRRYPDLQVHRLLDDMFNGRKSPAGFDELTLLGDHCSEREQRATKAERELIKEKLLHYFSERLGEEMDAIVTGVEEFGLFAQGVEIPAEGLIHVSSLQDDYYQFDRKSHTLSGRKAGNAFRLGDLIRVAVAHVDVERRKLDFRLIGKKKAPAKTAARTTGKKAKQKPSRPSGGKKLHTKKTSRKPAKKKQSKTSKPKGEAKKKKKATTAKGKGGEAKQGKPPRKKKRRK